MPRALIPLANGAEEMEAVITIDVLRRAEWTVVTAGLTDGPVTASRHVVLVPDTTWDEVDPETFDWIILPGGGPGAKNLQADARIAAALRQHMEAGKNTGAVCAAPTVLHAAGLLDGRTITSHPSVADQFGASVTRIDEPVVWDGNLITSQGPGTTFDFALAIVTAEDGAEKAQQLAEAMVLPTRV